MKKVDNFQRAEDQPQGVAYLLLNFLPIPVWRCLIKVLLTKKACTARRKVVENPAILKTLLVFCGN